MPLWCLDLIQLYLDCQDHSFDDGWFDVTWFFWFITYSMSYWGHIPFRARFTDLHGVACLSPFARCTPRWLSICYFYDDPSVEPLWNHSAKPTFLSIWLLSCFLFRETFPRCLDLIWITEITRLMMDDLMSPDLWPVVHSMPYWDIFSSWMRFTDLDGVACLSPLARCMPRRWPVRHFYNDSLVEPPGSHLAMPALLGT